MAKDVEPAGDTIEEGAIRNVHAEAWAERQRDPSRYENPSIPTPGVLDDIEGEAGPHSLVVAEDPPGADHPLDPSVDNRDQVQPMLETLYADALARNEEAGIPTPEALPEGVGSKPNQASTAERAAANKEASADAAAQRSDAPQSDVNK